MNSRQGALLVSVLLLQFSGILSDVSSCPTGCSCPTEISVVCKGISVFPAAPTTFTDFEFIDCRFDGDVMPQLPQPYANATSLILHNCSAVIRGDVFNFLVNLKNLTITGHHRLNFSTASPFRSLPSLRSLDLSDNGLSTLPRRLCSGISMVRCINASYNNLDAIETETFSECKNRLEEVYLMNNSFMTLSYESLPWYYLYYANMSGNPWKCDCKLHWVGELPKRSFSDARCESPEGLKGKDVRAVESLMSCGFGRYHVAIGLGIPVLILCIIMISYYGYRIAKSRRYKKRLRSSVKYSSVYGETVESNSKQSILA